MRVLPNVHEARRQHYMIQRRKLHLHSLHFQRKPLSPPTAGKGMPAGFYRGDAPPRVGSEQVQPAAPPPKFPDLLQPLQHIHLVHLSQPFLNQFKSLQRQRH